MLRLLAALWAMALCSASQQPSADLNFTPDQLWRFIDRAVKSEIQPLVTKLASRMDTLDSRLYTLDSRLDVLDSRVDAVTVRLHSHDSQLEEQATKLDRVPSQVDALNRKVESQLDGLVTKLDSQQSQLDGLVTKLDSQQSQLDGLVTRLDSQKSQMDSQQSQLDGLVTKLDSQQLHLDGQATKLDSQQSQLDGLVTKLDSQQSHLDGQATKLNSQQSQLDGLVTKLDSQQSQLDGQATKVDSQQSQLDGLASQLDNQDPRVDGLATKTDRQQTQIDGMTTQLDGVRTEPSTPAPPLRDCSDLPAGAQSGVHLLQPGLDRSVQVPAYCDLDTDGGNWTVIQRRADVQPRRDFYLGWQAYREGFGELDAEFWWGLEHVWAMTTSPDRRYELRINMEDFDGEKRHAVYQGFRISSEADGYRLAAANYTGDAGDSLDYHVGQRFSTHDRDQESDSRNCAQKYKGAWWYAGCHYSNLNGRYLSGSAPAEDGVSWQHWRGYTYSLKTVEMKIRPTNKIQ